MFAHNTTDPKALPVRGWIHEALLRRDVSYVLLENRSPLLTLSAPISVCKSSLLVSILFVKYQLGELVYIHQKFTFGDYFPKSHDLYVSQCADMKSRFDADHHWLKR